MLAMKDSDDVVRGSAFAIARKANKTEDEVLKAWKVLSSPDKKRLEPQPHEGRRIKKVDDGWFVLNGQEYREKVQDEMQKARWRRAQAAKRRRMRESDKPSSAAYKAREASEVAKFEDGKVDKDFQPV